MYSLFFFYSYFTIRFGVFHDLLFVWFSCLLTCGFVVYIVGFWGFCFVADRFVGFGVPRCCMTVFNFGLLFEVRFGVFVPACFVMFVFDLICASCFPCGFYGFSYGLIPGTFGVCYSYGVPCFGLGDLGYAVLCCLVVLFICLVVGCFGFAVYCLLLYNLVSLCSYVSSGFVCVMFNVFCCNLVFCVSCCTCCVICVVLLTCCYLIING